MKFKTLVTAGLIVLLGMASADAAARYGDACVLIQELGGVFKTLRLLAFGGAALILAGWAWTYITKGWDSSKGLDEAKNRGIGMLIGFFLLFGLGLIMQFLPGAFECGWETWGAMGA